MSQSSELKQVLQIHLNWHGARISFLTLFLLALLKVKTVNLSELCLGLGGQALAASSYKRLQRFFRGFALDQAPLAHVIVGWMQIPDHWVLSLDRTTWKVGKHWYNILTLGIAIKKHGRRAKSLFRLGLDYLRYLVLNPSASHESDFVQSLQLLSCT